MARVNECSNQQEFKLLRQVKEKVLKRLKRNANPFRASESSSSHGFKLSEFYCTTGDTSAVVFSFSETNFFILSYWEYTAYITCRSEYVS